MEGIFARDAAALAARSRCRHTAHVHTGGRRLHQRAAPRVAEEPHDRQRDQLEVQRADRLSGGGLDVVRPDGGDPHPGAHVRTRGGGGEAHRMSAVEAIPAPRRRPKLGAALWALVRRHMLTVYSLVFFAYLMLPIGVVIAFSFNNPAGRFNYTWQGFTWNNWRNWNAVPGLQSAIGLSLEIALIASFIATALGTLIALALVRYGFRGRAATNLLVFLPLSTPEIVLGASLLTLFLNFNVALGFMTIVIAHILFCISFAVVTVKARLIGFDRHLEEAAMDLGANEWTPVRRSRSRSSSGARPAWRRRRRST